VCRHCEIVCRDHVEGLREDRRKICVCIVPYLLKARTVEPEKQPLLANGSETTSFSRQRLVKHVPSAADTHATIELLLETVFSTRSVQRGYEEDSWGNRVISLLEKVKERNSWKGAAVQRELERGS
jgi:hypothetical protein